jgi:hypothetical protein
MGEKFGALGTAVGGALGKVGALFGGLTTVAAGLVAVIAAAVASIAVSLDKMFNNGRLLRAIKTRVGSIFGWDLPTGDEDPQDRAATLGRADRAIGPAKLRVDVRKDLRDAQRDYFAGTGQEEDFDKYNLEQALNEKKEAEHNWAKINKNAPAATQVSNEERLGAYEHVKEAQQHILDATRATTKELQTQLATQHQQVTQAKVLVEQEQARFKGRKAEFAKLPKEVRSQLAAIGNKIGAHKDLTESEAELSDRYGYFRKATTDFYSKKVSDPEERALIAGGESGVEEAVKAVADAKAKERDIQKSIEDSVRREKDLVKEIYQAWKDIIELKMATLRKDQRPDTNLPALGADTHAGLPAQHNGMPASERRSAAHGSQSGHGGSYGSYGSDHRQSAADFAHEFGEARRKHLLPAMTESLRGLGARITNASLIG